MIRECVITTHCADGSVHIAPMGVHDADDGLIIAPFKPSTTLNNVLREGFAVINYVDDVRIIAGCLTGRWLWPTHAAQRIPCHRLEAALAHTELALRRVHADPQRPRLFCHIVHEANHAPFRGFNRAQMAVLEAAILVSRLHMLPAQKIDQELEYLRIGLEKTAGPREREAWEWLMQHVAEYRHKHQEAYA